MRLKGCWFLSPVTSDRNTICGNSNNRMRSGLKGRIMIWWSSTRGSKSRSRVIINSSILPCRVCRRGKRNPGIDELKADSDRKKKPTFLSKQYFHQRSEAKSGRKAQFGSYKYTAADLYTRGELRHSHCRGEADHQVSSWASTSSRPTNSTKSTSFSHPMKSVSFLWKCPLRLSRPQEPVTP